MSNIETKVLHKVENQTYEPITDLIREPVWNQIKNSISLEIRCKLHQNVLNQIWSNSGVQVRNQTKSYLSHE